MVSLDLIEFYSPYKDCIDSYKKKKDIGCLNMHRPTNYGFSVYEGYFMSKI